MHFIVHQLTVICNLSQQVWFSLQHYNCVTLSTNNENYITQERAKTATIQQSLH